MGKERIDYIMQSKEKACIFVYKVYILNREEYFTSSQRVYNIKFRSALLSEFICY
jgi:hypothetical protein